MSKQIDALITKLFNARQAIAEANKEVTALVQIRDEIESKLLAAMDAIGTEQARNKVATATVSEKIMPKVEDWDKFYAFIHRYKAYYLLERRCASVAFRETLDTRSKPIPGTTTFTKRTVGIRTRT